MARQSEALTVQPAQEDKDWEAIEQLVMTGNIAGLNPAQRMRYYEHQCKRLGVDPESQALQYIKLGGRLTLYIGKGATDQIARNLKISRRIVRTERMGDVYIVTAEAFDHTGRVDQSTGALLLADRNGTQFAGDDLINALLKCESKAKRRATISFCGLGFLDETEVETIKGAEQVSIREAHTDKTTGEMPPRRVTVHEPPPTATPASQAQHDRIIELAGELFGTSGVAVTLHQDYTEESASAEIAALEERVADASMSAASVVLATDEQRGKVAACVAAFAKFGRPIEPPPASFTSAEIEQWLAVKRAVMSELKATANKDRSLSYAAAG